MASSTPKLALRKPDSTDLVNNVADLNDNFDKVDKLSRGELAIVSQIANSVGFSGATDIMNAGAVDLVASQKIKVEFDVHVQSTIANDVVAVEVREGVNTHKQFYIECTRALVSYHATGWVRLNLGAGTWIPRLTAYRFFGTGVITVICSVAAPGQFLIEDLGQP